MSRACSYISKIPSGFKEIIDAAQDLKLFQVSENGPTQFIFKDEEGEKFRIQIGYIISCSCANLKINNQCIHTLFVLIKKFRVNLESPIIWQGSYTDSETEDIINLKYAVSRRGANQSTRQYLQARQGTKKIDNSLKNAKQQLRQPLDEESICPICQEEMKDDQPLTYCRKKCGNNFHIKCLRVWIDHKLSSGDKITCPMCRTDMTNGIFDDIRRDEDEFNVKYVTHFGKICNGCNKKNILGNLFHCLYCDNLDLCNYCYDSMQHPIHQKFLLKRKKDQEWEIAPQRIKKPSFGNMNLIKSGLESQTLSVNHHHQQIIQSQYRQKNSGIDLKPTQIFNNITDYFVSCFSLFKDINQEQQLTSGLSIIGQEMNKNKNYCASCNQIDNHGLMRKLSCGHGIDSLCLKQLVTQNQIACPTCQTPILKGYVTAFDLKPQKLNSLSEIQIDGKTNIPNKQQDINSTNGIKKMNLKGKTMADKFKGSSTQKEGISDLALTGNLLIPLQSQQNIFNGGLEINGEKKNLNESEQQDIGLINTKKNSNFRIKKTTVVITKPPINRQLIKNDLNARIREQKENLSSLIQQGEFQLVGKEIFNKKDKNESDQTIRGSTIGQYNRRNSYGQNGISKNSNSQIKENLNSMNYNNHAINSQYDEYVNDEGSDVQKQDDSREIDIELNIQQTSISNQKNIQKLLNQSSDDLYFNDQNNQDLVEDNEESYEEQKENYNYQHEENINQINLDKNNNYQQQNQSDKSDSCEVDEEDEEFQRLLIEEYERQFGGQPQQENKQESSQAGKQFQEEIERQTNKIINKIEQRNEDNVEQNERSSSQYLTNQNTTDFSSSNNINQIENEYLDDLNETNQEAQSEGITIRGTTINRTNSINGRGFKNQNSLNSNSNLKAMSLNHKIRISNSQKMSQQRHGQKIKMPPTMQTQFEVVGQKPRVAAIQPQELLFQ